MHLLARTLLTVPRIVFSLWYLQTTLPRSLEIVGVVHAIAMTVIETVVLVIVPADVHSAVRLDGPRAVWEGAHSA